MKGPLMQRVLAVLGSAIFFVLAPVTVAGLVPWRISRWRFETSLTRWWPLAIVGAVLLIAGTLVLIDSFARFAFEGLGTPAPLFPPRRFVATGLYRYVRNPMYVAVVTIIGGQALMFGNARVLTYGVLVWLAFHVFVMAYEEPALRVKFGPEYEQYCISVPRWIPRLRPWRYGNTGR